MPIGKDSITKRVAKQTPQSEEKIAPELVATTAAAPAKKAPTKKTTTSNTKKTTAAKKPSTAKKPAAPKAEAASVETTVLANVAPETVAAVIGHNEKEAVEIVQIGEKMPTHLL